MDDNNVRFPGFQFEQVRETGISSDLDNIPTLEI